MSHILNLDGCAESGVLEIGMMKKTSEHAVLTYTYMGLIVNLMSKFSYSTYVCLRLAFKGRRGINFFLLTKMHVIIDSQNLTTGCNGFKRQST